MKIADLAAHVPDGPALLGPGRKPLSFGELTAHIERTTRTLKELGVGPRHRVALVLPNGPELASAFLSISARSPIAPLNPSYSLPEFRFYLEDLQAAALATIPGSCPAAEAAATALGIPLLEIVVDLSQPAGVFNVAGRKVCTKPGREQEDESGLALLLHSSGTTARPKLVGLSHANLLASAHAIAKTLRLRPDDRSLNIMPLFHIHGLIGSLLSSVSAGASVYCSPGFNALRFARWMEDADATWYSAVPTMHQALLSRTSEVASEIRGKIRFVRSSSAHLHTRVWQQMESEYNCPVLNAYGMTEAAHQIASNPLPPAARKYGSTGLAAGPEIAILDSSGTPRPAGYSGEVGIRGNNVTAGYLAPEEANNLAFVNGWFRTGDEGILDDDGYLTLTGRLKELINCGGEKVSPAEVDAVLMQHPAVAQAVAFAVPCATRGERVCAAVVLESATTEAELKRFARERLASFKTPGKVLIVTEIPKGATGKMQRIGMAARLGIE